MRKMKRFKFHPTPIMSTYLIAWTVGLFDYIEDFVRLPIVDNNDKNVVEATGATTGEQQQSQEEAAAQYRLLPIRVYTPIGMSEQGRFALKVAMDAILFYSTHFHSPFCMPKLDLVTVSLLDALAMENFGLLVFRQKYLLVNERTPIRLKQRIARLICHEIGHQWFGNLVSIQWWKYLWLKEGFARFLEYALVTSFYPHWNYWTHFSYDIYARAMEMDEESYTHPVECQVTNATEIQTIFDSISYGKGASIFRMLIHFIGQDVMWRGLAHFIRSHAYGAARTEDLWASFSHVTQLDIAELMDSWVKFSGHPVIVVSEESVEDDVEQMSTSTSTSTSIAAKTTNHFRIRQYLCSKNGDGWADIKDTRIINASTGHCEYNIPIRIKSSSDPRVHSVIMTKSQVIVELPFEMDLSDENNKNNNRHNGHNGHNGHCTNEQRQHHHSWIKFNFGHTGFYRVNYSKRLWKKLADAVRRDELSIDDSLGLLIDAFALIRYPVNHEAHMSIDTLFYLLQSFKYCRDEQIWLFITQQLQSLLPLMNEQRYIESMKMFVCGLYGDVINRLKLFDARNYGIEFLEQKSNHKDAGEEPGDEELSGDYLCSLTINLLSNCDHKLTIDLCWHHYRTFIDPLGRLDDDTLALELKKFNVDNFMTVVSIAVREGSKAEYELAKRMFHVTHSDSELQKNCFKMLWETRNKELMQETIHFMFNHSDITDDFVYNVGCLMARNETARSEIWHEIIDIAQREVDRYRNGIEIAATAKDQNSIRTSRHPLFYPMTVCLLSNLKFNCGNLQFLQMKLMAEIDILRHFINEKGLTAMLQTVHQNCKWVFENAVIVSNFLQSQTFLTSQI